VSLRGCQIYSYTVPNRPACPKCGNSMWTSLIQVKRKEGQVVMFWRCVSCQHEWTEASES